MRYRIEHQTHYHYSSQAILSYNDVCLDLRPTANQTLLSTEWKIEPLPQLDRSHQDLFGNRWRTLAFEQSMEKLSLTVVHQVEVSPPGPSQGAETSLCPQAFLWASPYIDLGPEFAEYARPSFPRGRPHIQGVMDLTTRIFHDFTYTPRSTVIGTRTGEVFKTRKGVCQDYAHFQIACLRSLGLPARYVSGYLNTLPKPGQEKVFGSDASHAWVSFYDEKEGWCDFDPTNGVRVDDGHITIAWGRDYGDVAPLKGVMLGGGTQVLRVLVDVRNLG